MWNNLGIIYGNAGQSAKAIEAFQQALHIDPKYALAWNNLGNIYKQSGQNSKVIEIYRRLKEIDPNEADVFFSKYILP